MEDIRCIVRWTNQPFLRARSWFLVFYLMTVLETMDATPPKNCVDVQKAGGKTGVHTIYPKDGKGIDVSCDLETDYGGWVVIQRRNIGRVDFYRPWAAYKAGFGDPAGELWLGNDNIHQLTSMTPHRLRIDMNSYNDQSAHADYKDFLLESEANNYTLRLGDFERDSTAGDSLEYHRDKPFSTYDRDYSVLDCASRRHGAWWYFRCLNSNLNGKYGKASGLSYIVWQHWKGMVGLHSTEMKIRPMYFKRPADCADIQKRGLNTISGVHKIFPKGFPVRAYCDFVSESGGWTMIQRRKGGSMDFYRTWDEYEKGFGDVEGEYWLGNEHIHRLTQSEQPQILRINMLDYKGNETFAQYESFVMDDAQANYALKLGKYLRHSSARDSLTVHQGMPFSTKDRSVSNNKCATTSKGGWWYLTQSSNGSCGESNINGVFGEGEGEQYMRWKNNDGAGSIKLTVVEIRPLDFLEDKDDCVGHKCQNAVKCVDELYGYYCECKPGYTGTKCEIDIDECVSNPCQNNGTCSDAPNAFVCSCVIGYIGNQCETNIDECSSSPCVNGVCSEQITGLYSCRCTLGYAGVNCEKEINECASVPCRNGGTCVNKVASYDCKCATGYTGTHCQTDIDECASSPCLYSGVCRESIDKYTCKCPTGTTGDQCELNVDECASRPCLNNGTCVDYTNSYVCRCIRRFRGTNCQIVNGCSSDPCTNGGTCTTVVSSSFICLCKKGTMGAFCEKDINECASNPCCNGGSCANLGGRFTCNCAKGFKGITCNARAVQISEVKEGSMIDCTVVAATGATESGVFTVVGTGKPMKVYCDLETDGGGWTVFQQRINGTVDFYRDWASYKNGFGDLAGEFWIGNDYIHNLTKTWNGSELRVELTDFDNETRVAMFGQFAIGDEKALYKLKIDDYMPSSKDAGDSLVYHSDSAFSTYDKDNSSKACATKRHGAWWYVYCLNSNLNGKYGKGYSFSLMVWQTWKGMGSIKGSKMMVRPQGFIPYKNECEFFPCENGGTCFDEIQGYRCECHSSYMGTNCGFEVNECDSLPCFHGGTCIDALGSFSCKCQPGYENLYCQTDIDWCASSPCQRDGTCVDKENAYECQCKPEYTGSHCEIGNMCVSNPCQHDSTCLSVVGVRYKCICSPGFYGDHCHFDTNECESNPCMNKGTCYNRQGSFMCSCQPGYIGLRCQYVDTNDCLSSPCQFGAACEDQAAGYRCICLPGFAGPDCHKMTDCSAIQLSGNTADGVYTIYPKGHDNPLKVFCDLKTNGGGWTVIQRRKDGSVDFYRNWQEYKKGFGHVGYEFWLGNDNINDVTAGGLYMLRVTLTSYKDEKKLAEYSRFEMGSEKDDYVLQIGEYITATSNAGDSLEYHHNAPFSTWDHDYTQAKCASKRHGAWWFKWCLNSNLNGEYGKGVGYSKMIWHHWLGMEGLKATEMKIRHASFEGEVTHHCYSTPCTNGGTCKNINEDFNCTCVNGFTGRNCEIDLNECDSSPCQYGGVCVNRPAMYSCKCQLGYVGYNCQIDLGRCFSNPCMNGAACVEKIHAFECSCASGYYGDVCETELKACASNPCQNGGMCNYKGGDYICRCFGSTGVNCETATDCAGVQGSGTRQSGVYTVHIGDQPVQVYCDLGTAGGGWTVFQRRESGLLNFYRKWKDYKSGFGNLSTDFWMGNDFLHRLTSNTIFILRVDLISFDHEHRFAEYADFSVENETSNYTLLLGQMDELSTAGDALDYHRNMPFSTWDRDHSLSGKCARRMYGGWWYRHCANANLNGRYQVGPGLSHIVWTNWKGMLSMKMVEMKIRPVDFVRERDVCLKDPCKNGGWCTIIRHGFFRCYCELGFVGDQCETDVDECHSSPCENGGNCTDGPGGFSCQCPLTFSGTNCEEDACNCPTLNTPTPCRVDLESGRCVALTKPGQPVDRILRVLTIILCIMAFILVVILIILIITYKTKSPARVHPVVDMRRK